MGRRKTGLRVDGWVNFDKPLNMTSTEAVTRVRRLFNAQKAGHAGTLDPLASGVLPIALGEATKTVPFLMDARKGYQFTVQFGASTASCDAEGEIIARSDARPREADTRAVLARFLGEIDQTPPIYSAIKVDGERAYDLARRGEAVEMKSRRVHLYAATLMAWTPPDHATFDIFCGKGFYVRALARDLVAGIGALPGAELVWLPTTNQGLVRFRDPVADTDAAHDARTDAIIAKVNASGEAFFGGTTWRGQRCIHPRHRHLVQTD